MIGARVTQTVRGAGIGAGRVWAAGANSSLELGLGPESADSGSTIVNLQRTWEAGGFVALAAAGERHFLSLDSMGRVYAWGQNTDGQCGQGAAVFDGDSVDRPEPVLELPSQCIAIAAGSFHSLAVDADGHVWAWGNNVKGQLGDGTTTATPYPTQVPGLNEIVAVAAGLDFSLALGVDGLVHSWGANTHGQLGAGTTTDRIIPGTVQKLENVMAISSCGGGGEHSLALTADGRLWGWGFNGYGQFGDGTTTDRSSPRPLPITDAIGVAAGAWHSVVLLSSGAVQASGANESGQLGDGTKDERHKFDFVTVAEGDDPEPNIPLTGVVEIASGGWHNLARTVDGHVRAWGSGNAGRMGTGDENDHTQPAFVHYEPYPLSPSVPSASVDYALGIAAGSMSSIVVRRPVAYLSGPKSPETAWSPVYAWGLGDHGQINGSSSPPYASYAVMVLDDLVPLSQVLGPAIAARRDHSMSTAHGAVWVWGEGPAGSGSALDPTPVTSLVSMFPHGVVALAAGEIGAAVLTSSGALWSWTPWSGVSSQIPVVGDQNVGLNCTAVALGRQYGVALTAQGTVWCWGRNDRGQLGNGPQGAGWQSQPSRVQLNGVTAVAAGADHSLALLANGTVCAWGANDQGQLGNNSTADAAAPVFVRRAGGALLRAKTIAAGGAHSLAVDASGGAWSWGSNDYGQLGIAATIPLATTAMPVVWVADGPRPVAMGAVKAVAAGAAHSLSLLADGRVFGWGSNADGQLGNAISVEPNSIGPSKMAPVSWVQPPDDDGFEQITELNGITAIAAGPLHSLAAI